MGHPGALPLAIGADGAAGFQFFTAADDWDVFPAANFWIASQQAPGFAVLFELGAGGTLSVGIEPGAFAIAEGIDRDDVPDIFRDDVGDKEIDFGGGVGDAAGSGGFDSVAMLGVSGGRFDLDAEESVAVVDDGVVAFAVSPREADGESEMSGAGEEGGFGGFSATLAGGGGDGVDGDDAGGRWFEQGVFPAGMDPARFDQNFGCAENKDRHNGKGAAGGCAGCSL
jgi:hypothetical protein